MKKLLIIAFSVFAIVFSGCLKDTPVVDFSKVGTIIEFEYPAGGGNTAIGSGLEYFGGGAILYPPTDAVDTATFMVNIAAPNTLSKDLVVTIGIDPNALADNYSRDSLIYLPMPDSLFQILNTTATVKAGSRLATFQIAFFPSKINLLQTYMLPIVITNAQGYTISGNFGHIYFHTIGNPIAGPYTQEWIRYNNAAGTGAPAYDQTFGTIFAPVNGTTISVSSGTGVIYILTFTNTGGVLSNFQVSLDPGSVTKAAITITGGPTIILADPVNHKYQFNFTYNNSSGSPRNITDKFN